MPPDIVQHSLASIIAAIDEALAELERPLSRESLSAGWTTGIQSNWLKGLQITRQELAEKIIKSQHSYNFARDLGWDAIEHGDLAMRLTRIGHALRMFAAKKQWWKFW